MTVETILFAAQAAYMVGVGPVSVMVDVSVVVVVKVIIEVLVNDKVAREVRVVEASIGILVVVVV